MSVKCSSSLNIFEQKKNTSHSWFFEIRAVSRTRWSFHFSSIFWVVKYSEVIAHLVCV